MKRVGGWRLAVRGWGRGQFTAGPDQTTPSLRHEHRAAPRRIYTDVSLCFFALCLTGGLAHGQTRGQSPTEQALNWFQSEWKVVKQQGRSAADRVVREYPQKFRAVKSQVARISQVAAQVADAHRLEEKKELLVELWQVRGSLDILAICSPDVIHQLTGLDVAQVASLEDQVARIRKQLGG